MQQTTAKEHKVEPEGKIKRHIFFMASKKRPVG